MPCMAHMCACSLAAKPPMSDSAARSHARRVHACRCGWGTPAKRCRPACRAASCAATGAWPENLRHPAALRWACMCSCRGSWGGSGLRAARGLHQSGSMAWLGGRLSCMHLVNSPGYAPYSHAWRSTHSTPSACHSHCHPAEALFVTMFVMFTWAASPSSSSTLSETAVARRGVLPLRASCERGSPRSGGAWGAGGLRERVGYCRSLDVCCGRLAALSSVGRGCIVHLARAFRRSQSAHPVGCANLRV